MLIYNYTSTKVNFPSVECFFVYLVVLLVLSFCIRCIDIKKSLLLITFIFKSIDYNT